MKDQIKGVSIDDLWFDLLMSFMVIFNGVAAFLVYVTSY